MISHHIKISSRCNGLSITKTNVESTMISKGLTVTSTVVFEHSQFDGSDTNQLLEFGTNKKNMRDN